VKKNSIQVAQDDSFLFILAMIILKINMTHRRLGNVRLHEGDRLFTEKLARGLDPELS